MTFSGNTSIHDKNTVELSFEITTRSCSIETLACVVISFPIAVFNGALPSDMT